MSSPRTIVALLALGLLAAACGSDPAATFHRQVLFRLEAQGGGACARLDHVASARTQHRLVPNRVFVLGEGESQTILLANGVPPYRGRFAWAADGCPDTSGAIVVTALEVQGPRAEPRVLDAARPVVTIDLRQDVPGPVADTLEQPRARFEVCSPVAVGAGCAGGRSGRSFTGTIGDAELSHILSVLEADDAATTPAILFLEKPRNRVSGLFRGAPDQLIRSELYVNDVLRDSGDSAGDVVLRFDL